VNHLVVSGDSLEFIVGTQHLMHEHAAVVPERSSELPENHRLTRRVFSGVVRWGDRWLTDEGKPVVEASLGI
jgi:hypothetical protein